MILAALDVGSNSIRLLVAKVCDGQVFPIHTEKITSRLIAGLRGGILAGDALTRSGEAIARLAKKARALDAERVEAFGTSALRDGQNRDVLVESAAACGVSLRVLSGAEEAELAYAGAAPAGKCLVVDIGGGSTELLSGAGGRVLASLSVPMGAVRLTEALPGAIDHQTLTSAARAALWPAWEAVRPFPAGRAVGVGGTITSLAALCLALSPYDPEKVQDYPLTSDAARAWLVRLCEMPLEERRRLPGLNPERADIIPAGAAILAAFFDLTGVKTLFVSDRDNLAGYIRRIMIPSENR